MDISPLYELRLRLKNLMISGSGLIGEDFRLKRAAEAMKPLEAASPVFAKIGQLLKVLLSEECKDPEGVLLDTITLVDAVCCTQGAVSVPGEIKEIEIESWGSTVTNAPYSVLHTLIEALTTSGGGRYGFVTETHEAHPELFEDYRVKQVMVQALGASYAELAEQVAQWLKESGEAVLPLLYKDFDPKGKREMLRRVQVIEAIAGAGANDFYLKELPEAEKDVRAALIYALRHEGKNADLLMELVKTEKGNCKKMAHWALVSMGGENVAEFWKKYMEKKPQEAISYLAESCTDWASLLVAGGLKEKLEPWVGYSPSKENAPHLTKETAGELFAFLRALPGKTGPLVCECFRIMVDIKGNLNRKVEGEKAVWSLSALPGCGGHGAVPFQRAVSYLLQYMFYIKPDKGLGELAEALFEEFGEEYFPAAATANRFFMTEKEYVEWIDGQMHKKSVLGKKLDREMVPNLYQAFQCLYWDEERQGYVQRIEPISEADEKRHAVCHPVYQPLDGYFTDLFMECRDSKLDEIMAGWIKTGDKEYCDKVTAYFYNRARTTQANYMYLEPLRRCGFKTCEGLAVEYFKARGKVNAWEISGYLNGLPGTWEAKLKEAEALDELIESGQVKGMYLKERVSEFMDMARLRLGEEAEEG